MFLYITGLPRYTERSLHDLKQFLIINNIQEIYRILYFDGLNNSEAYLKISNNITDSNEKNEILDFISKSDRGLIKGI